MLLNMNESGLGFETQAILRADIHTPAGGNFTSSAEVESRTFCCHGTFVVTTLHFTPLQFKKSHFSFSACSQLVQTVFSF